jgi:hypothetical protein
MILRCIISSDKTDKSTEQLIVAVLDQRIDRIGATKLEETSTKETRLIVQDIAIQWAKEEIKHLTYPEDFIGWRRRWLDNGNAEIMVVRERILSRIVEGSRQSCRPAIDHLMTPGQPRRRIHLKRRHRGRRI